MFLVLFATFRSTRPQNMTQQSRRLLSTSAIWHLFYPFNDQLTELIQRSTILDIKSQQRAHQLWKSLVQNMAIQHAESASHGELFKLLWWSILLVGWLVVSMFTSTSAEELRQQGAFVSVSLWKPWKPVRCLKGNGLCFTSLSLFIQPSPDWLVKALNFLTCCEDGHFFSYCLV